MISQPFRQLIFLLFLLAFYLQVLAQPTPSPLLTEGADRVVRLSIAHLGDPFVPGPHLSYEHRVKGNVYLRHELGIILNYNYPDQAFLQDLSGMRYRIGRRKYLPNSGIIRRRHFNEIAFDYHYLNALAAGDFQRNGFSGFRQRINYSIIKHSFTLNYIRGLSLIFGEHWQIDLGIGAGLRFNYQKYSQIPEGASFITNGSLYWRYGFREPLHLSLSVPLIFALGYQF